MEMKSIFGVLGASALLMMSSCQDDPQMPTATPLAPGSEIQFGAILEENNARTVYGQETQQDGKTVWPIYWKYASANAASTSFDHIYIYSPQGNGERNQASFTVKPETTNQNTAATVVKDGSYGVQVGDQGTYDFYAIYPASAVTQRASGTVIYGTLPGDQEVIVDGTLPTTGENGRNYTSTQDMTNCLMMGSKTNVALQENTPVSINFTPFSSVLDITVNGPMTNTQTDKTTARVTSIMVTADAPITGDFSYDFATGEGTYTGSNVLNISALGYDTDGDLVGAPLVNDNTLNVKAFILPNPAVTTITVQVLTTDAQVWKKKLNMTNFSPKTIHKVTLPLIDLNEDNFDYSVWLSQLDPRIYVSELSLPGSVFSFSKNATEAINQTQTLDIADQFKAGIRVFQSHIFLGDQVSEVDGGDSSILISVLGKAIPKGNNEFLSFVDVIKELNKEMAENHSSEFCVLLLSDWAFNNGDGTYYINGVTTTTTGTGGTMTQTKNLGNYSMQNLYERMKVIFDNPELSKLLVTSFDENSTIDDVKGKVIVKYATNSSSSINTYLNGANALFNQWYGTAGSQVLYSQLKWATTVGIASTQSATNGNTSYVAPDPMLYIHAEQADPFKGTAWNFDSALPSQVRAYNQYYNSDNHNIFGMSFVGGNGGTVGTSSATTADVANHMNPIWLNAVNALTVKKPLGWVLFNCVGNSATTTGECIRKVISQNNDNSFKLKRNQAAGKLPESPSGDIQAVTDGGDLL